VAPPEPLVSVVVPTHNRAGRLARLVDALGRQAGGVPMELVVVDDASTDGTWAELERLARGAPFPVRPLRLDRNAGPATARNAGWRAARGAYVAFTDDDCVPQPGWLAALVEAFADADVVQGVTFPDPVQAAGRGPFSYTLNVVRESGWYETCNLALRREWLEKLGGFDEGYRHPAGEDTDLGWRAREAGARRVFAPRATVLHDVHPSGLRDRLRGLHRWEGVVRAVRDHPDLRQHLYRRWFWKWSHPPAIVAGAGLAAAAAIVARTPSRWPAGALVAAAGCAPYGWFRLFVSHLPGGLSSLPAIPAGLVLDLGEVVVMARASARYRTLVL
jgi:GT2 family glycosyltransferase